jgi:hypothetical protein
MGLDLSFTGFVETQGDNAIAFKTRRTLYFIHIQGAGVPARADLKVFDGFVLTLVAHPHGKTGRVFTFKVQVEIQIAETGPVGQDLLGNDIGPFGFVREV